MVDYLILTFIREEHDAVWELFRNSAQEVISNRSGHPRVVSIEIEEGNSVKVAIARTSRQGNLSAQDAVLKLIDEQKPRLVLTAGIAGAVPTSDVFLGDVVLANDVHDLTRSAETAQGREEAAASCYLMNAVKEFVANLTTDDFTERQNWAATIPRPLIRSIGKRWTGDEEWDRKIDIVLSQNENRMSPIVVDGVIASSDQLIKSADVMKRRLLVDRDILANDMESAGVAHACDRRAVPVLILRSISDIIGHPRSDDWKRYACTVVAACVFDIVRLEAVETIESSLPNQNPAISSATATVIQSLTTVLAQIRQRDISDAAPLCREAFELFKKLPDKLRRKWAPELFDALDKPMKYLGNKKLVLDVAKACIDCCSGTDLDDDAAKCQARALICGTSWSYQRTGQLGLAEEDAKASVQISKGINDQRNLAFCKKCLGRLQRMRSEATTNSELTQEYLNESAKYLREAIDSFSNLNGPDDPEVGDCYSLLGRTCLVMGDLDLAKKCAHYARLRIEIDSKDYLDLLILEGDIYLSTAECSKALECYQTAIDLAVEGGYQISEILARAHRQKAEALRRSDRHTDAEAESAFFDAQRIWEHYDEENFATEAEWGRILLTKKLDRRTIRLLEAENSVVRCVAVRLHDEMQAKRSRSVVARRVGSDDTVWKNLIRKARRQIALRSDSH